MTDSTAAASPGHLIRALLAERDWTQDVLASVLRMEQSAVSRVVQNKRSVDAALALALADAFQLPAERFLEAQNRYDLAKARAEMEPNPARSLRAELFAQLPVAEMIRRGWIQADSVRDADRVEAELMRFFGANSPEEIEILPHAAKKTEVSGDVTPAQLIWLHRARAIANEMLVPRYTPALVNHAIEKLDSLLLSATEVRHVPRILGEAGIRFVLVETTVGAKIDGATLWLNDMAPVVAMTLRHDRIDNFWFVLRHELEHVKRGHGRRRAIIDVDIDGKRAFPTPQIAEEERVANEAAANFCVPSDQMDRFISKKSPYFAERDVLGFAATLKLHPGLVVGQLQHKTGKFDRLRNHLTKIRDFIKPSAVVDGWGDVYPLAISQ